MNMYENLHEFRDGYYHKVMSKETLWTISKKYDKDIKHLMYINNLTNVSVSDKKYILIVRK